MSHWRLLFSLAALAAAAGSTVNAQNRPDFTGTWKLNESGSTAPATGAHQIVFRIEHKEPAFRYSASGKQGFTSFSEAYEFTTDGKMPADPSKVSVSGHWEGQALVLRYFKNNRELAKFRFRIQTDGKQMTREADLSNNRKIRETYDRE